MAQMCAEFWIYIPYFTYIEVIFNILYRNIVQMCTIYEKNTLPNIHCMAWQISQSDSVLRLKRPMIWQTLWSKEVSLSWRRQPSIHNVGKTLYVVYMYIYIYIHDMIYLKNKII